MDRAPVIKSLSTSLSVVRTLSLLVRASSAEGLLWDSSWGFQAEFGCISEFGVRD
jgi:hypothetical protein